MGLCLSVVLGLRRWRVRPKGRLLGGLLWGVSGLLGSLLQAQFVEERPLSNDFYKARREALRALLPPRAVAVFFAAPVRNRSNSVDYVYHPQRDFFYLTGFSAPHTLLLVFKEPQTNPKTDRHFDEVLFTRTRDARKELYDGTRLSPEAAMQELGIAEAYSAGNFAELALDFDALDKVFFLPLPEDVRNTKDTADLYDLILQFKQKVRYPVDYNADVHALYQQVSQKEFLLRPDAAEEIDRLLEKQPQLRADPLWQRLVAAATPEQRLQASASLGPSYRRLDANTLPQHMTTLREIKTQEEIRLLRRAIRISCIAQNEVMRSIHPNMSEREVQGIHEFIYRKYGVAHEGYPSIVGSGHNGCVLHYIQNAKGRLGENQLILMDLGAEYHGYTADVTRTIPVGGRFTQEQRQIYDIVLAAQEKTLSICRPGATFSQINKVARGAVAQGLQRLGLLSKEEEVRHYLPHGVTHHIGLDVHDRGHYDSLAQNMVITIEPGIYVPENSPCDEKWWGIAIRIEDDILITEAGYELLSADSPRRAEDIEALMREPKTLFYDYQLPPLDSLERTDRGR